MVTLRSDLNVRHEGRGLTLDKVIAFEAGDVADRPVGEGNYDECIWEGDRVVAVLRYRGNTCETIRLGPAADEI